MQPLMWDDMLRSVPVEELRRAELGRLVEPVVWAYGESVDAQGGTLEGFADIIHFHCLQWTSFGLLILWFSFKIS